MKPLLGPAFSGYLAVPSMSRPASRRQASTCFWSFASIRAARCSSSARALALSVFSNIAMYATSSSPSRTASSILVGTRFFQLSEGGGASANLMEPRLLLAKLRVEALLAAGAPAARAEAAKSASATAVEVESGEWRVNNASWGGDEWFGDGREFRKQLPVLRVEVAAQFEGEGDELRVVAGDSVSCN